MTYSPGRLIENTIFSVTQKFYKNGIEIEKGTVLTQDRIEKNRKLYEYYCNLWTAYPDLFLDLISRSDEKIELYFQKGTKNNEKVHFPHRSSYDDHGSHRNPRIR